MLTRRLIMMLWKRAACGDRNSWYDTMCQLLDEENIHFITQLAEPNNLILVMVDGTELYMDHRLPGPQSLDTYLRAGYVI